MRKLLIGATVVVLLLGAGAFGALWFMSKPVSVPAPALADNPPLKPATRTSVVVAPVSITLAAIRDMMEVQTPRELTGKRDNPVGAVLQNSELVWVVARGQYAIAGRPDGVVAATQLAGAFRLSGQINPQVGNQLGNIAGALGIQNEAINKQIDSLKSRPVDQRAEARGNVAIAARPAFLPNWRIEPNLTAQVDIADTNLSVAGVRLNVGREVKPYLDRTVAEQVRALSARLRDDPFIERIVRTEWARMCRSVPIGKTVAGAPNLWLEVRPLRAIAAQPKIDANAVTLTFGVQAETRILPSESRPECAFPATVEIVPQMEQGRVSIGVPADIPFPEVNRLIAAQLAGKTFPKDGSGVAAVTVNSATVAPSGNRLLISMKIKAKETKSWFGLGVQGDVHIWCKPVLDPAQQVLRLTDIELDVKSEQALVGPAARAAIPLLKAALADQATIDLKPFKADARKSIEMAVTEFRRSQPDVQVDAVLNDLRLAAIEFDAKVLRVIAEAEGTVKVTVNALPR